MLRFFPSFQSVLHFGLTSISPLYTLCSNQQEKAMDDIKLTDHETDVLLALTLGDKFIHLDVVRVLCRVHGEFRQGIQNKAITHLEDAGYIEVLVDPAPGHENGRWKKTGMYRLAIRKIKEAPVNTESLSRRLLALHNELRRCGELCKLTGSKDCEEYGDALVEQSKQARAFYRHIKYRENS